MVVTVKMPGTCGELVQGIIEGVNFHITCPVDLYSYATVKINKSSTKINIDDRAKKTKAALRKTLAYFNCEDVGLEVSLRSELIPQKGMASSTADITAAVVATILALGEKVTDNLVKEIALAVEPTDGSFIKGIVAFDHLKGARLTRLGQIDSIPLLIFDTGGAVDTLEFNSRENLFTLKEAKEEQVTKAYQLVEQGIREKNSALIGQGATLSSLANQLILRKPNLSKVIKLVTNREDVLGVNIAHSGTLLGILLKENTDLKKMILEIQTAIPRLQHIATTKLINGGYQVVRRD